MDIISHALLGLDITSNIIKNPTEIAQVAFFSGLPDMFQFPLYLFIGYKKRRPLWIPWHSDWKGFRKKHPLWFGLWELPNSVVFFLLIVLPFIYFYNFPLTCAVGYLAHIASDIFTHTGEWSAKPFYPFNYTIEGFSDPWRWPVRYWFLQWVILVAAILIAKNFFI